MSNICPSVGSYTFVVISLPITTTNRIPNRGAYFGAWQTSSKAIAIPYLFATIITRITFIAEACAGATLIYYTVTIIIYIITDFD